MVWDKATIQSILRYAMDNPNARLSDTLTYGHVVYRMLQAMYNRQTMDEQFEHTTSHLNGVGFNSNDADILSSIAERSQQYNGLTERQVVLVAHRLYKYAGQLASIAKEKTNAA